MLPEPDDDDQKPDEQNPIQSGTVRLKRMSKPLQNRADDSRILIRHWAHKIGRPFLRERPNSIDAVFLRAGQRTGHAQSLRERKIFDGNKLICTSTSH